MQITHLIFDKNDGFHTASLADSLPEYVDDQDTIESSLAQIGYVRRDCFEPPFKPDEPAAFEVFERPGTWPFVFCVPVSDYYQFVFVRDHGAMFELRLRLLGVSDTGKSADKLDSLLYIMEKLFRAYHGHDYAIPCRACSPVELEAQKAYAARRAARIAAKAADKPQPL